MLPVRPCDHIARCILDPVVLLGEEARVVEEEDEAAGAGILHQGRFLCVIAFGGIGDQQLLWRMRSSREPVRGDTLEVDAGLVSPIEGGAILVDDVVDAFVGDEVGIEEAGADAAGLAGQRADEGRLLGVVGPKNRDGSGCADAVLQFTHVVAVVLRYCGVIHDEGVGTLCR